MLSIINVIYDTTKNIKHTFVNWRGFKLTKFLIKPFSFLPFKVVNCINTNIVQILCYAFTNTWYLV